MLKEVVKQGMSKHLQVGKIVYAYRQHKGPAYVQTILLTLIDENDDDILLSKGLRGLRLRRIVRLAREAERQGALLGYDDLSRLLLTSLATLKRDVAYLERSGEEVALRNRRKRCDEGTEHTIGGMLKEEGDLKACRVAGRY